MRVSVSTRWLQLSTLAVLAALYVPAMVELIDAWRTDTYAIHGMFVPLFSALIAWIERDRLRAATGRGHPAGIAVILTGVGLLALGTLGQSLLLKGLSVAVVVAGLVMWSFGARCLRAAIFPVGFLLLMAPLPRAIVAVVTLKIQVFAAA